ncbi:MAG: putative metalloprotease CJM1_0395 family protein [Pseudomonadota bacterium]|nr:putative metalloprotease CJM1_0395 family protein [Pseudomonadota bacterium]
MQIASPAMMPVSVFPPRTVESSPIDADASQSNALPKGVSSTGTSAGEASVVPETTPSSSRNEGSSRIEGQGKQTQAATSAQSPYELSDDDLDLIKALQSRDLEVRNHERAHATAGGELAGAISYSYTRGPDGARYATSGEVSIDTSEVPGDPGATYDKMARVRRAALAPAEPSAQDRRVAAMAAQKMTEAQAELANEQREAMQAEADLRNEQRTQANDELQQARERQNEMRSGDDSEEKEEFISVADRYAEYNARLRQINETLLRISGPQAPQGRLLDETA